MIRPNVLGICRVNHNIKIQIESPFPFSALVDFRFCNYYCSNIQAACSNNILPWLILNDVLFLLMFSVFAYCFHSGNNIVCDIAGNAQLYWGSYGTLFFDYSLKDILTKIRL